MAQVTVRGETEGCQFGRDEPQADAVDAEQLDRVVEDVLEQASEVEGAADLGRDPSERVALGDPVRQQRQARRARW
jgi:hypothetical protein